MYTRILDMIISSLKFIKTRMNIKTLIKNMVAKRFAKIFFLESLIKYSNGIGYGASLETEVQFLVNTNSNDFILFDIGANIGDFSKKVTEKYPKSTIYSFEPSKFTFELLENNVKQDKRIKPINVGFGECEETRTLYSNASGSGMASLYDRDLNDTGIEFTQSEIVKIANLDNWVKLNKVIPDYIKIDVEGSELSVLKGGVETLQYVRAVQFEFGGTAIDARTFFKDYWNFFSPLNFSIYRYTPGGLMQIVNYSEKEERFEYMNYLAISKNLEHR